MLDSLADFRAAVESYDERYGTLLRSGFVDEDLVASTAGGRRRVLADAHDAPVLAARRFGVHAVVAGAAPAGYLEALRQTVAAVSCVEVDPGSSLAVTGLEEALAGDPAPPWWLAAAAARHQLPVLVLRAGEALDVRDADQLRGALPALARTSATGVIRVRDGWSRRIWPAPSAAGAGLASRPVYSVIVDPGSDWLPDPTPGQRVPAGRRFVVAALSYTHRSGGITALHRLCHLLNRLGADASLLPLGADNRLLAPGQPFETNPDWYTPISGPEPFGDDTVVVYPEVVVGDPIGAANVVRWLLNRPAVITGQGMGEGPDDLQVAFDSSFGIGRPLLRFPQVDPRIFFPKDVPGEFGLIWVYKGQVPARLVRGGLVEILGDWPADRDALGAILRRATELVSCDWCSVMTHEAAMCATPAVLVRDSHGDFSSSYVDGQPIGPEWLDLRPMVRVEDTPAGPARDGSAVAFHAYLDHIAMWADELGDFVALANDHFDRVRDRVPV